MSFDNKIQSVRVERFLKCWEERFESKKEMFDLIMKSLPFEVEKYLEILPLQPKSFGTLPVNLYPYTFWDLYQRDDSLPRVILTKGKYCGPDNSHLSEKEIEEDNQFADSCIYLFLAACFDKSGNQEIGDYIQNDQKW